MLRNIGRVEISKQLVQDNPEVVQAIISEMLPLQVLDHIDRNVFEYIGISKHFDEVPLGILKNIPINMI